MTTSQTVIKNPTWWRRRTLMERYCTVLAAAAIFLCGVLTIALSVLYIRDTHRPEEMPSVTAALDGDKDMMARQSYDKYNDKQDICLTPGCVYAAADVLGSMDKDVDPCDDFYQFACGKFIEKTIIPDDKTSMTLFSKIDDTLTDQLRKIIEEKSAEDEPKPFKMAKNLYHSCMNKSRIEEVGLTHMQKIIKRLGGWPVLEGDQWDGSDFTWKDTTYKFKNEGFSVDYLIDFSITTDYKNSSNRIIDLDQYSPSLNKELMDKGMEDKIVKAYYQYMVDMTVMFGADRHKAEHEMKQALEFEMKLANISLPPEERRDANKLYNPMTIPELQERFPSIPWFEYLTTLMPESVHIKPDERVIVDVPSYIHSLEALLSTTPKRIQANYLLWRAVASAVSSLTEALRKRQLEYGTVLSGRTEREPRWKECVGLSAGSLSLAMGSLYVKRYFKEDAKKNALEMVANIREEMYKILQTVDWMDEDTRKNALKKARSMMPHIGYPDELLEVGKLEEFYEPLEIMENGGYMESILNLTKFGLNYSFTRLRKPVNKTDWVTHGRPAIVNAFYSSIENSIQFPAGILQGAFFSNNRPNYMNYGAIGFVIGHEITHGFDDQGRQFDDEGNLVDWWAAETKEAYLKKAACIIQQYGNYTAKEVDLNLNGVNTQGENIADNGGIKQAYKAYNHWVQTHGAEKRLPGLQEYTPRQMFWISAANTWCSTYRPETLKLRIITGVHSPGEFRVRGPFSNRPEFAKDFKCPSGSKMNPVKKCQVW